VKLQNRDLQGAVRPLQELIQEKFPVSTSFALAKLVNTLNDPLKVIEDVRQGLIRKYHTTEGPMAVEQGTPEFDKFNTDFNELMDQEVELKFDKVKLPLTIDGHELMIAPASLLALEMFLDMDGAEPAPKKKPAKKEPKED